MMKFKDWYIAKHGIYPKATPGELISDVMARLADDFSEYVDEVVAEKMAPPTWRPDVDA